MHNTLSSLSILAVNLDSGKDYIETFVPFIVHLFNKRDYLEVDPYVVSRDFEEEYGLTIPPLAMLTILTRTKHRGYIREEKKKYFPVKEKVVEDDFGIIAKDQERKFKQVILEFIDFSNDNYHIEITEEMADDALINFLKKNDLQILFACKDGTILPNVNTSKTAEYILGQFIYTSSQNRLNIFRYIVDIAIGHIVASTILYNNYNEFQAYPETITYFLDIGLLFSILGLNGPEREVCYKELISSLKQRGAILKVFKHTLRELDDILETARLKIEQKIYDPKRASRTLRYFKEKNFSSTQVEIFQNDVNRKLREMGISIEDVPEYRKDGLYQLDESKLHDYIVEAYRDRDPDFCVEDKEYTINLDVDSISAIYRLRKGNKPRKLRDAVCALICSNSTLAHANKKFEIAEYDSPPVIPCVLTDMFIGTFIWLNSPMQVMKSFNEKMVIAFSYAALQPSTTLINKLIDRAEILREDERITHDQYVLLRETSTVRFLLAEKTLGDPDNFEDKTAFDILDEIEKKANSRVLEVENKMQENLGKMETLLNTQASEHETKMNQVLEKNEKIQEENESANDTIDRLIRILANIIIIFIGSLISFILLAFILIAALPNIFPDLRQQSPTLWIVTIMVSIILNIVNNFFGWSLMGIIPFLRHKIELWIRKKIHHPTKS